MTLRYTSTTDRHNQCILYVTTLEQDQLLNRKGSNSGSQQVVCAITRMYPIR